MNKVLYSSKSNEWCTPQYFFDLLNAEFNFTLDPCASFSNAKTDLYKRNRSISFYGSNILTIQEQNYDIKNLFPL